VCVCVCVCVRVCVCGQKAASSLQFPSKRSTSFSSPLAGGTILSSSLSPPCCYSPWPGLRGPGSCFIGTEALSSVTGPDSGSIGSRPCHGLHRPDPWVNRPGALPVFLANFFRTGGETVFSTERCSSAHVSIIICHVCGKAISGTEHYYRIAALPARQL